MKPKAFLRTTAAAAMGSAIFFSTPVSATCLPEQVSLKPGSKIVFEGDSLTYGFDEAEMNGAPKINNGWARRSQTPYPEEVGKSLPGVQIVNHGFPGDRSIDGIKRWASSSNGDLTVLMYGTNDAGNFGKLERTLTTQEFHANLQNLIDRRISAGSKVILVTPPPIADSAVDAGVERYRDVVRNTAQARNMALVEAPQALADVATKWVDGLHLSPAANQSLAKALAKKICLTVSP
ncbi:SGNH/GDSL hydrolase family protein [Agrobacterium sp. SOY23]|uniref:SGNH/GDSL hydrolase family protein n=1 Tax=Agrobacterium sp. SOY23 TaxID=3014555 RepID=UPI0022AF8379|nr:SGNH/GDSL hydrolase family protein [Agrobacterium sp. SOY23]MCZ4428957.1 SGNH/GDSL hydrolase family protein [Agrobacterium sp. SOY23]